jgi:hypothetical protein
MPNEPITIHNGSRRVSEHPIATQFGLLKVSKSPLCKSHKCKLPKPTIWSQILKLFGIDLLKKGDLWRCEDCGLVYKHSNWYLSHTHDGGGYVRNCVHSCSHFCSYWIHGSIEEWKRAGGVE